LKQFLTALAVAALTSIAPGAFAQETKVAIGISGWTGFAPLTLAKEAGLDLSSLPYTDAGKARTDSLGRKKPLVKIKGRQMLYVITLRPLFFRRSTPRQRVATVLHELFHISHSFDGTLDHQRRHEEAGDGFEAQFAPIERRCWKRVPPELIAPFAYDGEVRVVQWLEKPQSWLPGERASQRTLYTEAHLFEGVVRMKTNPLKTVH
jgi:hypothetical protein